MLLRLAYLSVTRIGLTEAEIAAMTDRPQSEVSEIPWAGRSCPARRSWHRRRPEDPPVAAVRTDSNRVARYPRRSGSVSGAAIGVAALLQILNGQG